MSVSEILRPGVMPTARTGTSAAVARPTDGEGTGMRVVVIGGTGNVGLAVTRALLADERVTEVTLVARRAGGAPPGARQLTVDIASDDLMPVVRDAAVVIHLAWLIQPSRSLAAQRRVNVEGTARLLTAVAAARVPALVYASSVGAYSPATTSALVDESWPTHGIPTSAYSRQKAYVERMLDDFEVRHGQIRVVRLRPGLIFQPEAAAEQRRYFAGPLLPRAVLRPGVLPVTPHLPGVRFQAVHADDVADAYLRATVGDARGAYNVAADPVLSTLDVADLLAARPLPVPFAVARGALDASWRLRLHPLSPGWMDLAARSPIMDTTRVRDELGWHPRHDGRMALRAVLRGMAEGTAGPTPPLRARQVGVELLEALRTGMGGSDGVRPPAEDHDRHDDRR